MAQLTREMVERWARQTHPDNPEKSHMTTTIWEEHQFCVAWLKQAESQGWRPIEAAPRDEVVLGLVSGKARLIKFGKTSHVPMHGWCLADQGVEDFDLADPTGWQPLPPSPEGGK